MKTIFHISNQLGFGTVCFTKYLINNNSVIGTNTIEVHRDLELHCTRTGELTF